MPKAHALEGIEHQIKLLHDVIATAKVFTGNKTLTETLETIADNLSYHVEQLQTT